MPKTVNESSGASPIPLRFLCDPVHFLALGLGSGMSRYAPGTFGTLAALLIFWSVHVLIGPIHWLVFLSLLILAALTGIYLCGKTASDLGVHDQGGIVWDEFVGFWMSMFLIPVTWQWLLAAFVLFRFFDIVKPWPVGWADRRVSGGSGIMLDDLIAAGYVLIILHLVKRVLV